MNTANRCLSSNDFQTACRRVPVLRAAHFRVPIRSPNDLEKALLRAAECIDNGVLTDITVPFHEFKHGLIVSDGLSRNVWPPESFDGCRYFSTDKSGRRRVTGGWNDMVSHHFLCRYCRTVFHLGAETYHGSGGAWECEGVAPTDFQAV
ncbi:hypothetical protein [Neisseria sp.]|uniref:hypothetical protein n=1 Tax=Neisseria sp. TaxID=192066 RepID=UPI0035A077D4